ncbi:MAG TPA: LCP family protein [Candidatus Saccharimonadales bacterium]|nr:LCP family protein [Candidatus Saccharimonadales bacterium]
MNRHKKFNGSASTARIDGFVSGGRQLGVPLAQPRPLRKQPKALEPITLGSATRRMDGFYTARPKLNTAVTKEPEIEESALLDEPIILDDTKPPFSKRYFGRAHPKLHLILKRGSLALLALILIGGAYFAAKIYITEHHLLRGGGGAPALASNIDINQLKGEGDGRINVLLLGKGGPGHDGPDLTDTIMVASIDPINNKVALLSIPRDLWVKIPNNGYQKINAAYADGKSESHATTMAGKERDGLNLLDQTIEPIIGIPIHYHVVLDFAAFRDAVNALGGVQINVTEQLYDPTMAWENGWNPVLAKPGLQTMYGKQALMYARSRETSSDFARGQRQRQLIVAIKNKALSLGTFSNPIKVSNLMNSFGNNVFTDFSLNDVGRAYQIMQKIPSNQITSIDLVTPPHNFLTTGNMNGLSVVEPRAGLFNYSAITNYIRNTLRDGFLAKEDAALAVYNATDRVGLAGSEANVLKSYGYKVKTVANTSAVTNPSKTTLVDLTKGKDKYTRHYLERRFGVSARTSVPSDTGVTPPAGTNFVIILGEDVNSSQ